MSDFNNNQTIDTGSLPVRLVAATSSNPAALKSGQRKIATGGTAIALSATSVPLSNGAIIKALDTNSGKIAVGPAGVTSVTDGTGGATGGYILAAGEGCPAPANDAANIYINGATAGDGVSWIGS